MIRKKTIRNAHQDESGQTLALGALSMLILALMLMMSFNVNQAIHSKIQLQQQSDALAYSMAVAEARAFNFMAYSNRAMAAGYVSMMSLHAYMSAATSTVAMSTAAAWNFFFMGLMELAQCCACTYCSCVQHCVEWIEDWSIASDYNDLADDQTDNIESLDPHFRRAMTALDFMIDEIHGAQLAVLTKLSTATLLGSDFEEMKEANAPNAGDLPGAVGALNVHALACAVEDPPVLNLLAIACGNSTKNDQEKRAKVMTEVANATRPNEHVAERFIMPIIPVLGFVHPSFMSDFVSDIPDDGMSFPFPHGGTAKAVDDKGELESGQQGSEGKVIAAADDGMVISYKDHAAMIWFYDSEISSDSDGGSHDPAHDGDDHNFQEVNADGGFSCVLQNNCFIKFRPNDEKDEDFGQPAVYSFLRADLGKWKVRSIGSPEKRIYVEGDGRPPWQLTDSGTTAFTHGDQGRGVLDLRPGEGMALSKALVYYHRLGNWQAHPNLFQPYWRAKLHPFTGTEAGVVLGAAGEVEWGLVAATGLVPLP